MTIRTGAGGRLAAFLKEMVESGSSDLHIAVSSAPRIRIKGRLDALDHPPLTGQETQDILCTFLSEAKKQRLEKDRELRFAFDIEGLARFRGSLFFQQQTLAGVFRVIPHRLASLDDLAIPPVVQTMCQSRNGLVLVSGGRSSGKSTTLAAIVDWINVHQSYHVLTIEDPVEFVHVNAKSIISQREIMRDALSISQALDSAMTEDIDVIMISELADVETTDKAMEAALSGHLVLSAVSSISALDAVSKVIEEFPPERQSRAKARLSTCLRGIIHQTLVPRADGNGMAVALEVLNRTPAVQNLIREDKVHQIYSLMQSQGGAGMITLNQSLAGLVAKGIIAREAAIEASPSRNELLDILSRTTPPQSG
jgi:twitching motility protein PilT